MTRVLIVGGGIAGLTAAIALRTRSGGAIDVDIAETSGEAVGAVIGAREGASEILRRIGVFDELAAISRVSHPTDYQAYAPDGTALPMNLSGIPGAPDDLPLGLFVYRPDLAAVLTSAAERAGARLLPLGVTAATIDNAPTGATVRFTDDSASRYDLVVGADGVRSSTRRALFGDAYVPVFAGELSFRWVFDASDVDLPTGFYMGRNGFFLFARGGRDIGHFTSTLLTPQPRFFDADEARAHMRHVLDGCSSPAFDAVKAKLDDDAEVVCRGFESVWIDEPWFRERTVIIGDAAHATSAHLGAGAWMALEDGWVLADEIVGASSIDDALERYHERRRGRAHLVYSTSLRLLELEAEGQSAGLESGLLYKNAAEQLLAPA